MLREFITFYWTTNRLQKFILNCSANISLISKLYRILTIKNELSLRNDEQQESRQSTAVKVLPGESMAVLLHSVITIYFR